MDPQQELFTALLTALRELGYVVYDGALPPEDASYPFLYLGDVRQNDHTTKNAVYGYVYLTIHIWHNNVKQRGTLSKVLLDVKRVCRTLERTAHFAWLPQGISQRVIADDTTNTPLLHGVMEAEYKFS